MKDLLKRLLGRKRMTSDDVVNKLRQRGAKVGEDVTVFSPSTTFIDGTCAHLLTIGDHVGIAMGARILTHDYSWSVLKAYEAENLKPGAILGAQAPVEIGSHVFIGMNAIITAGVKIGDHVVIGAGSVVTKDCPSGAVYAGNPARRICTIEEFYRKRQEKQLEEAKTVARCYQARHGVKPPVEVFTEYFMLFLTSREAATIPAFKRQMALMGNYDETCAYMDAQKPMFAGYEAFLAACFDEA